MVTYSIGLGRSPTGANSQFASLKPMDRPPRARSRGDVTGATDVFGQPKGAFCMTEASFAVSGVSAPPFGLLLVL